MMYIVAFFLLFLAMGFTFALVRKVADIVIGLAGLGTFVLVCVGIHEGGISSWGQLFLVAILAGVVAGLVCIPILPLSTYLKELVKEEMGEEREKKQE